MTFVADRTIKAGDDIFDVAVREAKADFVLSSAVMAEASPNDEGGVSASVSITEDNTFRIGMNTLSQLQNSESAFAIDGGAGVDTVLLADDVMLDYRAVSGRIKDIEDFDLGRYDGGEVLKISLDDVLKIRATSENKDVLLIAGAEGDTLELFSGHDDSWSITETREIGDEQYHFYSNTLSEQVLLAVDTDISVNMLIL